MLKENKLPCFGKNSVPRDPVHTFSDIFEKTSLLSILGSQVGDIFGCQKRIAPSVSGRRMKTVILRTLFRADRFDGTVSLLSCRVVSSRVVSCRAVPCRIMLCCVLSFRVLPCRVVWKDEKEDFRQHFNGHFVHLSGY